MPPSKSTPPSSKRSSCVPPETPGTAKARAQKRLKTALRRAQILELRKRGRGLAQIADELGISRQAVHKHIAVAMARIVDEPAQEVVKLEVMRLDALLDGVWLSATTGETRSVEAALQIMARRAKLLGLDAAAKKEISGPGGGPIATRDVSSMSDEELAELALGVRRHPSDPSGD
jgi:DNA-binding CsgD family transcriptional regulator